MKTATARKKKDEALPPKPMMLVAKLRVRNSIATVDQLCPRCDNGLTSPAITDVANLDEAVISCHNCGAEVVTFEPALESDRAIPGTGSETAAPGIPEDTAHPPILGEGKADMLSFFTEDLANKELARKSLEPTTSQFDAPTFGMKGHDIDEEVEEATAPKFPVLRAALLGALISIVFFALLGAAAWYFEIPLPQQKPAPMVQPTLQPEARPLPPADGSTGTQWNKITCGDKPNGECTANPVPPFQFALTMNEDAWVEVDVDGKESLPGHILKKDENHIWFSVSNVNVRCGKPGAVSYFVNGKPETPPNSADKPDKVEVVNFVSGKYPKEQ